jgi:serine/threonine protein kinase
MTPANNDPNNTDPQNLNMQQPAAPSRDGQVQRIGAYTVQAVIGRGSTGTVYRAISDAGQVVALKRITVLTAEDERKRLRIEARALGTLRHPNTLRLIDVVDTDTDLALVTEYISGGSLRDRITQGPLSPSETVELLAPLAEALQEAHAAGIVHRDVKPSNVLLRDDGSAVLADFGLALDDVRVSQTSTAALGSAAYLDPEILDGRKPSPSSDTYSLGVVAYETITGRLPFEGDTTLAVLRNADKGAFQPLDRDRFGALAPAIERAFARTASDRFASAKDVAESWRTALHRPAPLLAAIAATTTGQAAEPQLPEPDRGPRATAKFRIPTRPLGLEQATPQKPAKPWKKIGLATAGLFVLAGSGFGAWQTFGTDKQLVGAVLPVRADCDPRTTAQCVKTYKRDSAGISVSFVGDASPTNFTVGREDDVLRVQNFFCGGAETLALYRKASGTIYYFKSWPLPGKTTEVVADATGILNANVLVGDYDNDGCTDIALDANNKRTWFLPATQQDRLLLVASPR